MQNETTDKSITIAKKNAVKSSHAPKSIRAAFSVSTKPNGVILVKMKK